MNPKLYIETILRAAALVAALLWACAAHASAGGPVVTVEVENRPLTEVLDIIERRSGYNFLFNEKLVDVGRHVSVRYRGRPLGEVLDGLFASAGVEWQIIGNTIVLSPRPRAAATVQPRPFVLHVVDERGRPVAGATVLVAGTRRGVTTDAGGVAEIHGLSRRAVLKVSHVGCRMQEIATGGETSATVMLVQESVDVDEVVVVGYGEQRRRDLSGAVATVKGPAFGEWPVSSVAQVLGGRVAGLRVQRNDGNPGSPVQVRVRGTSSVRGGNEPLWIVDGFAADPDMLSTSDIESVEVLKDASAAAIYGSRGTNGVIIVTTRRPRQGRVSVSYDGSVGVQRLARKPELLGAAEYMEFLNAKSEARGGESIFAPGQVAAAGRGTDWLEEIFRPATMTNHAVEIGGGNGRVQGSLGVGYFDQRGIIEKSGVRRFSLRSRVGYDISEVVAVEAGVVLSRTDRDMLDSQGGMRGLSLISAALVAPPTASPRNADGSWNEMTDQPVAVMNPKAYLAEVGNRRTADRAVATLSLTVKPTRGLSVKIAANVNAGNSRGEYYKSLDYPSSSGAAGISLAESIQLSNSNIVTYDTSFGHHRLTAAAGATLDRSVMRTTGTGMAEGFVSDMTGVYDLGGALVKGLPSSGYSEWSLFSVLGRVNYSYDDRYLLTLNFRADGSSRYSPGNRWGCFPSIAAAWRLAREGFMAGAGWLSDLKLRVSYGVTGNTAIPPYSTLNLMSSVNAVFDKELAVGWAPADTYMTSLRWETTGQLDIGVDASLWGGRLRLEADYYRKRTHDLLSSVEMPRSSGYTTSLRNVGSLRNTGFELHIEGRPVQRGVVWDIGANFSLNRNRVLSLADGRDIFGATVSNGLLSDQLNIVREGEPLGLFYGYVEDGYDDKGHIVYRDLDGREGISAADKRIIGDPNPDFLLDVTTTLRWRRFTLGVLLQSVVGGDIYSLSMSTLTCDYGYNGNVLRGVPDNCWTPQRPDAEYPALTQTSYRMSDRFVYDGSYMRLRNVELAYDIPAARSRSVRSASVYVSGQNLLTVTRYPFWDPEVNTHGGANSLVQGVDQYNYPGARSFTVGVRLKF